MKLVIAWGLLPLALMACGPGSVSMGVPQGYQDPTANAGGSGTGSTSSGGAADGLPCDVSSLLQSQCQACHSSPPVGGAPMPLTTYADLMAPSRSDPTKTNAQLSVTRMQSSTSPMPPGTHMTSAQIAVLADWVAAGAPAGSCQSGSSSNSSGTSTGGYDTPAQCTSNAYWSGGEGSSRMHPGGACIACHSSGEGPSFNIAGTLYPTAHEPDDCNGTAAAVIQITDAAGNTVSLTPNSAGNFYSSSSFQFPIRASVTAGGRTRTMATAQMSGDCNSCHTESGSNGAPGRVMVP